MEVLNFKKEDPGASLKPKLEILVTFYLSPMGNFGIKTVPFKQLDLLSMAGTQTESAYYHTTEGFNQ